MVLIPNIDGNYKTKDGRIKVVVSRKTIEITIKNDDYTIIDEDNHDNNKRNSGGGSGGNEIQRRMKIVGKGLTGISEALIGE